MRHGSILIVGLLLASTAMPQSAQARPRLLGNILNVLTAPVGVILGASRQAGRRAAYRRPAPARVAAPAAAAAAAATVVASAPAVAAAPSTTGSASDADPTTVDDADAAASTRVPRLGVVGPVAWPSAYEDVIGFTLWPKQYGSRLGAHGMGDVLSTALAPSRAIAARTRQANAGEPGQAMTEPAACGSIDLTAEDWPIGEITSTVELNDIQSGKLNQLRMSMSDAIASIKSTCLDDSTLGPVERLRAMQNSLWAVQDAVQLTRTPLSEFYASLTEEQQRTFAAPPQPAARMGRADIARMCDLPAGTDAPMKQIEHALRPTKPQKASLDALQKTASEMGQMLMQTCLAPMPATPVERLDAAANRLTAVIFAATNVNVALDDFASQLRDDQKTKLNSLVR